MDVSIIIVNYNTRDLTLQCLRSIYSKTEGVDFEVIVVDNDSKDDSVEAIRSECPQAKLINTGGNIGFGRANNLGAKYASGEYLFLLNSDTVLLNNTVKIFFDFMKTNIKSLNIGILGCLLLDQNHNEVGSWGYIPTIKNQLTGLLRLSPQYSLFTSEMHKCYKTEQFVEVEYITGADMFILKERFERIGKFDPNIFMYYEETDLQKRLLQNGFHQYIINGPEIIHLEGSSITRKCNNFKRIIVSRSLFYYIKKHYSHLKYCAFRICYVMLRVPSLFDYKYSIKERIQYFKHLLDIN